MGIISFVAQALGEDKEELRKIKLKKKLWMSCIKSSGGDLLDDFYVL